MGSFFSLGKSSNDTQENPKDAQKTEEALKKVQEENAKLNRERNDLAREKDKLASQNTDLTTEKDKLADKNKELDDQVGLLKEQIKSLEQSQQVLENENTDLTNKIAELSKEKDKLERKHAPYKKLEKLYEVFLEVKDRLNFDFVATTYSAMDLIASVLSDSKYYLESLYNKASQELSDKRSDKGEKLAELFDLLFEYIKDSKFERLKEPSAYDSTCKSLYPEQNTSQKRQRVVLRGYKHNDKVYYTIVDMGS
ncbi:M protein [Helicobacter pylori]